MLVVTITNWRRKLVWVLAVLLVMTAVMMGQWSSARSNNNLPATTEIKREIVRETRSQKQGLLDGLLSKLRQYYQGQQAGRVQ